MKAMVLSKSIIGSHYKELGFTWLFYFHFAQKCVTLGQGLYSKLFCFHVLGRSQLFRTIYTDSMYGQLKETTFSKWKNGFSL